MKFGLVGGTATVIHYLLLVALVELSGVVPTLASAVGFSISAIANYYLNYFYTFRSQNAHTIAFPRFLTVAVVGLLVNTVIMYVLASLMGLYYVLAQMTATGGALIWNFLANNFWSFVPAPDRD